MNKSNNYKHGEAHAAQRTTEYQSWARMKRRCYNPNDISFRLYGGRGIKVCDRWRESYENFLTDMGRKPGKNYSLGRINSESDYGPHNCSWQTATQQSRNLSNNKLTMAAAREIRMLYDRGYTTRELAKEFGISDSLASQVIHRKIWREEP